MKGVLCSIRLELQRCRLPADSHMHSLAHCFIHMLLCLSNRVEVSHLTLRL